MKQRKKASIIFAAGMLLLAGCQKDDLQGRGERMMLNLEAFGSGSKTVLGDDDRSLQWLSGDQVRINGVDYTVSTSGDEAYVSDVPEASSYKALFPASMAEGHSMSGTTVTATLPRQYEYRTEGGLQVLDAPLAAVGDGSAGLTFRHLTGALTVVIKNTTSNTLYIDSVVLSSAQQLCGNITVDFDNLTAVSPNTSPSNPEDTMVLLTVPYNTLSVAAGAEVKVQIPVLPVSDDNRFSVHVATRYQGTRYDFDRRQGATSNALARNEMGYVPASIAISGTHISVRPLFEYQLNEDYGMSIEVNSPLDFMLLSDATNNDWSTPTGYSYIEVFSVGFDGTIDMEGYTIRPLILNGKDGWLDIGGKNNCQINNLTIEGSHLLFGDYPPYIATWFWVRYITFNNLTINVPASSSSASPLFSNYDSKDAGVQGVHVNGLTFNCPNTSVNRSLNLAGLINECDLYEIDNMIWSMSFSECSVTDISVNITGTPIKHLYFGGLTNNLYYNLESITDNKFYLGGSYTQNKPLYLEASGSIYYGGMASNCFEMEQDNSIDFQYVGTLVHNVSLNAPVVVAGGIMGYFDNECQEGDVVWDNTGRAVTQSGTIHINASTTLRSGKLIAAAVAPCAGVDFTDPTLVEYGISYLGTGNINSDALTIED